MCTLYYHNFYTYTCSGLTLLVRTYLYISKPFTQLNVCTYSLSILHSMWPFSIVRVFTYIIYKCVYILLLLLLLLLYYNGGKSYRKNMNLSTLLILLYCILLDHKIYIYICICIYSMHCILYYAMHMHARLLLLVSSLPCVNYNTAWLLSCSSPLTV